jgi:hypothetical protein
MFSNDSSLDSSNPSYASVDLDGDGIDESFTQSYDTDGDGHYDATIVQADTDGDGIAENITYFEDLDTDGDGILDQTIIRMDVDGDGVVDYTQKVAYVDYESGNLFSDNPDSTLTDPLEDTEHWHRQESNDTCAIACQEFILDHFGEEYGFDFSEDQLVDIATANGWYLPGGGTSLENTGKLLEAHGIPVERGSGGTLEDLAEKLERGEKVIAAIDADEIWSDEQTATLEDWSGDSIPGQDANHAVQVIGIDYSNPERPMVILNDPGHDGGQGAMVPADQFINAWNDSNNYMVATAVNSPVSDNSTIASATLAGSHDREGNWWWSDGTVEPGYNWNTGYA